MIVLESPHYPLKMLWYVFVSISYLSDFIFLTLLVDYCEIRK